MSTNPLGSFFLGDIQRNRALNSSPPSSPPPPQPTISPSSISTVFAQAQMASAGVQAADSESASVNHLADLAKQSKIDPELALELRLRWLEAVLLGVNNNKGDGNRSKQKGQKKTLVREVADIQKRLNEIVEANDGLKKFMDSYSAHAHYLTPAFALSGVVPSAAPSYDHMTQAEIEALLAEMEPDIREAERGMSEIEQLEARGVLDAGKLVDYEQLEPRLLALQQAREEDRQLAASLESRITAIMQLHATTVDALSELFVDWDETVTSAESAIKRLERQKEERQRLGLE